MSQPVSTYDDAICWLLREHSGDVPLDAEKLPEVRLVADTHWVRPERVVADMRAAWARLTRASTRFQPRHVRAPVPYDL